MLLKKAKVNRPKFLPVRPSNLFFVIKRIKQSLRRLLVGDRTDYMSPYVIFGPSHRCLLKNLFDPPKNLFNSIGPKLTSRWQPGNSALRGVKRTHGWRAAYVAF